MSRMTAKGLCMVLRQMETEKSSAPRATMQDALTRLGSSPMRKNRRGLKAATWIVFSCPTNEMSDCHPSRSMTAATNTGPFMALDAAMNAPSGDQLRRRKNVDDGDSSNGFDTFSTHSQLSVFQMRTVLSSDCCQHRRHSVPHLGGEEVPNRIPRHALDERVVRVNSDHAFWRQRGRGAAHQSCWCNPR